MLNHKGKQKSILHIKDSRLKSQVKDYYMTEEICLSRENMLAKWCIMEVADYSQEKDYLSEEIYLYKESMLAKWCIMEAISYAIEINVSTLSIN